MMQMLFYKDNIPNIRKENELWYHYLLLLVISQILFHTLTHFTLTTIHEAHSIITPIFQIKKQRHTWVKTFTQDK